MVIKAIINKRQTIHFWSLSSVFGTKINTWPHSAAVSDHPAPKKQNKCCSMMDDGCRHVDYVMGQMIRTCMDFQLGRKDERAVIERGRREKWDEWQAKLGAKWGFDPPERPINHLHCVPCRTTVGFMSWSSAQITAVSKTSSAHVVVDIADCCAAAVGEIAHCVFHRCPQIDRHPVQWPF